MQKPAWHQKAAEYSLVEMHIKCGQIHAFVFTEELKFFSYANVLTLFAAHMKSYIYHFLTHCIVCMTEIDSLDIWILLLVLWKYLCKRSTMYYNNLVWIDDEKWRSLNCLSFQMNSNLIRAMNDQPLYGILTRGVIFHWSTITSPTSQIGEIYYGESWIIRVNGILDIISKLYL